MRPTKEHLDIINSRLPGTKMSADAVEVLPFRVFDNKITDRYTIMSIEMARKVARDLCEGRAAFNALHASRQSLPAGRSVTGRVVEKEVEGYWELQAMMYAALKRPDGSEFAEGKDLADRYNMGAAYACSAGVTVGFYKCNICGNDIRSYNDCEHIPGRKYTVDEQPKTCIAFMTGHNIKDGVAEDCGIYEVSAVTAGGVANASNLTEAFGRYEDGADPVEFKKSVLDKNIQTRLELTAAPLDYTPEEIGMPITKEEVKAMLTAHYDVLKLANDDLEVKLKAKTAEFVAVSTASDELLGRFNALYAEKKELDTEFAQAKIDLEAANAAAATGNAYKAAFVAVVCANGVKAGETIDEAAYAALPIEELQAKNVVFAAAIAKLPVGQQSVGDDDRQAEVTGLSDEFYKA